MFCNKCGTKSIEGSAFCQKCGAKLIVGDAPQQASAPMSSNSIQSQALSPQTDKLKKKKSKKLPIILSAVALIIVAIIIVANLGDKTDYIMTVKAWKPFGSSGITATYGQVVNKFVDSAKWEQNVVGQGEASVVAKGKITIDGETLDIMLAVAVSGATSDMASMRIAAGTLGGKTFSVDEAKDFVSEMFIAFDEGRSGISSVKSSVKSNDTLYTTYTSEDHGFSFKYPSDWIESGSYAYDIVRVSEDNVVSFTVLEVYDLPFDLGSGDERLIASSVNELYEFISVSNVEINGTEMRLLVYIDETVNVLDQAFLITTFFYFNGNMGYQIRCQFPYDEAEIYDVVFEAIMDSYTIANAGGSSGTGVGAANQHSGEIFFNGVPVSTLFGMSINEAIAALGTSANIDENRLYFDGIEFRLEDGKIVSAESFEPEKLTFNGVSLNKDRTELVNLLGDPSWESMGGSGHELTFELGNYSLVIATGDVDGTAWRISLYPIKQTSQSTTTLPELPHGWTWTTQTITLDGVKITMDLPSEWKLIEDVQPWGSSIGIADIGEPFLWIGDVFEGMGSTETLVASGISSQEFMFDNMGAGYRIEFDDSTVMWVPMNSWLGITFSHERHRGIYLAYSEIIEAVARSFNWSSN